MDLPISLMADSVGEGNIYFFTDECPIGVAGHMHVCIKKADEVLVFSTCSSQIDTAFRLAKLRGWDLNTFPVLRQNAVNKFTKEQTYLNCNNVIRCGLGEFSRILKEGKARRLEGDLTELDLELVAKGVKLSTIVPENIKKMF